MLLKLLGFIDIAVATLLYLGAQGVGVSRWYVLFVAAHAIKALYFFRSWLSILDLLAAAYTIIFPFWNHPALTLIVVLFLGVKGLYSFF